LCSCNDIRWLRSLAVNTSYGGAVTNDSSWSARYRNARNGAKIGTEQDWQVAEGNPSSVGFA
jgi:hypothetical protein